MSKNKNKTKEISTEVDLISLSDLQMQLPKEEAKVINISNKEVSKQKSKKTKNEK